MCNLSYQENKLSLRISISIKYVNQFRDNTRKGSWSLAKKLVLSRMLDTYLLNELNPSESQCVKDSPMILIILLNTYLIWQVGRHPLSYYYYNGTMIVQTFVMVSSFLLAYNLLLHVDGDSKRTLSLKMLPQCLFHRIAR